MSNETLEQRQLGYILQGYEWDHALELARRDLEPQAENDNED